MKEKIKSIVTQLVRAIKQHPVEVLLAVFFCCLGCVYHEVGKEMERAENMLIYFPVLFLITYTLNLLTIQIKIRWIYYISAFFCIPFLWVDSKIGSPTYLVTLVVAQLLYLVSSWDRDNDLFVGTGLRYLKALFSALLLSGVAFLLSVTIYYSIRYIFDIWQNGESRFLAYAGYIAFMGVLPLLFLMFNQDKEREEGGNKLFDVLLNYVLSPALLIYAAILYLYFVKVAVLWSLPKGAVAYIVVSFILATFVLKGCQTFLSKKYYNWFYRYTSLIVLPALAMYWVGACYRINQYGFTEARVYLIVVGLVLTGITFLFFSKRLGSYLYAACLTIFFLSIVTYIPGITAKNIEIVSQTKRGNYPPKEQKSEKSFFLAIESNAPIDIAGYKTIEPVYDYKVKNGMWIRETDDSLFFFDKDSKLIFRENIIELIERQLHKNGITSIDSVPPATYPKLLSLDLDSALLIFDQIVIHNRNYRQYSQEDLKPITVLPKYYIKK